MALGFSSALRGAAMHDGCGRCTSERRRLASVSEHGERDDTTGSVFRNGTEKLNGSQVFLPVQRSNLLSLADARMGIELVGKGRGRAGQGRAGQAAGQGRFLFWQDLRAASERKMNDVDMIA